MRLKAVFVLSGSAVYDAKAVQERLFAGLGLPRPSTRVQQEKAPEEVTKETREQEEVQEKEQKGGNMNALALECAILDGKVRLEAYTR